MIAPRHLWLVPIMPATAQRAFAIVEGGYTVHMDFERAKAAADAMSLCSGFRVEPIDVLVEPGLARVSLAA